MCSMMCLNDGFYCAFHDVLNEGFYCVFHYVFNDVLNEGF